MPKYKQITRKQAIKIAKDKGIKEPRKMSTRDLINAKGTPAKLSHM